MVERGVGRDPDCDQLVYQPVVVVEAGGIYMATPLGNDPRPRDREAVGVEPILAS